MSKLNHFLIPHDAPCRKRLLELLVGVKYEARLDDNYFVTEKDGDRLWLQLNEEGYSCDLGVIGSKKVGISNV